MDFLFRFELKRFPLDMDLILVVNRHQDWNEGIYKVLADEIRDLRGQGYRIVLQGDFNAWVGNVLERGGIPGNRQKVTKNGELFLSFLAENNLANVNAAVRTQGNWETRICKGLWTRHASDYVSSSILDYVVVSSEHLGTIVEMVVDQGGLHGGTSDHNMLFTRVVDKFKAVPELPPVRNAGWDTEKADWPKFREVVQGEVGHLISGTTKASGVDSMSDVLSRALIKGLNVAVGKRSSAHPRRTLFPRHIVALIKERKELEKRFKTEKEI